MATTRNFAVEDGNLSSSLTTARVRKFSDVDLSFTAKATGDIFKKSALTKKSPALPCQGKQNRSGWHR